MIDRETIVKLAPILEHIVRMATEREREEVALLVEELGAQGLGTLAIAAAIRQRGNNA